MKNSTIDKIINTFDESYEIHKDKMHDKYSSVDMFVKVSARYVNQLKFDETIPESEENIFKSYFENHVRSMYRRDYETDTLHSEIEQNSVPHSHRLLIYIPYGATGGALGSLFLYVLTRSPSAALAGSLLGITGSLKLAHEGINGDRSKILGTKQYDKKLRKGLRYELKKTN
jgi:hypothetical protein